eukprot:10487827-Prorocentrum_lima.AAC.1
MMKQQLKQIKVPKIKKFEKEELYLPNASQEAVEKSLRHGISNPASAGLKSVPVSCKEVADRKRGSNDRMACKHQQ